MNALPFYIAGVVSPPQYLGRCASGQGFSAPDAARRGRSRSWHGFSSAQVLVDMSNGSIKLLQDGAGEECKQPGNDVTRDADRRQGQSVDIIFNGAKEWRRIPVAEHSFYHHIAASAASHCHHEPCRPPFRDTPWRKARTGTEQLRDRCSGERAYATWPCVREEPRAPCTPSCKNQGRSDNAKEGREKWLVRQFAMLTEDLLQAVRQDRLNAHGFSRELLELKDRPLPLASGLKPARMSFLYRPRAPPFHLSSGSCRNSLGGAILLQFYVTVSSSVSVSLCVSLCFSVPPHLPSLHLTCHDVSHDASDSCCAPPALSQDVRGRAEGWLDAGPRA